MVTMKELYDEFVKIRTSSGCHPCSFETWKKLYSHQIPRKINPHSMDKDFKMSYERDDKM